MRDKRAYAAAVIVVLVTVLYFWSKSELAQQSRLGAVTVYSPSASGMSIYHALSNSARAGATSVNRRAVLGEGDLAGVAAVAIFSPTALISAHEARLLRAFVERGGKLLLGAHNPDTLAALAPLLAALDISVRFVDNPAYLAGKADEVMVNIDDSLMRGGETYAFYSAYNIDEPGRYFIDNEIEKGEVFFFAGLPPVGNALIGLKSNPALARRLAEWGPLAIDEYHHFFSEKTIWDLLRHPAFALPLGGLMLALLLFFLFAHTEFHERTAFVRTRKSRSFHDLNEQILLSVFEGSDAHGSALALHEKFLRRIFPREREKIDRLTGGRRTNGIRLSRAAMLERATRLLKFHQEQLQQRGARE